MDRRERMGDLTLLLQAALEGWQANIWTALPGQYVGAGSKKGTANVQPTVQGRFLNQDGETWGPWQSLPVCQDCPIIFPGGGGAHLTFPLAAGDEGLIVFASRCIDNWWLQGGPQPPAMVRFHDLSDGFFIPGCFSQPRAPSAAWSTSTTRLTSDDGVTYVDLNTSGQVVSIVAPGGIALVGPMTFTDNVKISGTLEVTSGVTADAGMTVSGGFVVDGTLTANSGATISGVVSVTSDVSIGGTALPSVLSHTHQYQATTGASAPAQTNKPTSGT